jgi:signal recognition particle subunit SRP54
MADMMKMMGKNKGMMQRMAGALGMGGAGAGPSPADVERMQAELSRLDPKALEQLPKELKDALPKGGGLPGLGGVVPRFPGLPGLGGGAPRFPMSPGKKK